MATHTLGCEEDEALARHGRDVSVPMQLSLCGMLPTSHSLCLEKWRVCWFWCA